MSTPKDIDWAKIEGMLPIEKTEEQRAKRKEMFDSFDPNGNGYLSLAEVDRGLNMIGLFELYDCKKVVMRAFQAAKNVHPSKQGGNEDYVERNEFRLLLVYLRQYFELWQIFDTVDTSQDHGIDLEEFKAALSKIESWGLAIENPESEFAKIDTNSGGQILFDEFSEWAIQKGLTSEDDDE